MSSTEQLEQYDLEPGTVGFLWDQGMIYPTREQRVDWIALPLGESMEITDERTGRRYRLRKHEPVMVPYYRETIEELGEEAR